ncbi:MAG: hypothetical protein MI975_08505 [Cytophagales bacterium]|nr:hypothetical protein [Cytophagales bacterium]
MDRDLDADAGEAAVREAVVHHSSTGKFAIRQGRWKMIPQPGSGGWTRPIAVKPESAKLQGQLYDLESDPAESNNLWAEKPEIVDRLAALLEKYKSNEQTAPCR